MLKRVIQYIQGRLQQRDLIRLANQADNGQTINITGLRGEELMQALAQGSSKEPIGLRVCAWILRRI